MATDNNYTSKEVGQPDKGLSYNSIEMGQEPPIEERLRYDGTATSLHSRLLSRLIARRKLSERAISRRFDSWSRVDEHIRLFIDLSRKAKNADGTTGDKKEMPWARSIVVPVSYAILQVYLTQLMGIFTKRDPPIEVHGVGPEDIKPAKLMNAVIAYDQVQTNYVLELYTALQDAMKYGQGGFHDCWQEEHGYKTVRSNPAMSMFRRLMGQPTQWREWGKICEYNKVEAWDPYAFYPDPRVSLSNIQYGEFCGHRLWRGYLEIESESQDNGGIYFNTKQIKYSSPKGQPLKSRNRFQASQMNMLGSVDERDRGFHAIDSFMVELIPEEWQLGTGTRPEKWHFAWVDDQVIIRAHPADYEHGQFNYSAFESNIDTHVFLNQGSIENLDGLNRFMNWEYNAHIQNQIRFLNNRMIYDPFLVEAMDVENPDAAMHVRLTAAGSQLLREGKMSVDQMIHQLQISDVTTALVQSVNQMFDFAMRMSGAADQMMGRQTQDKRTLGEIQRVGHEGSMRMAMHAGMMNVQGIRPLVLRWASNRQQYTEMEQYVRIAGNDAIEFGGDRVKIKPDDIRGNYDYRPPSFLDNDDEQEVMKTLSEGLMMMLKQPGIIALPDKNGKTIDPHEVFKEIARLGKVRNIDDFYRQMGGRPGQQMPGTNVQVVPDEVAAQQAQAGNIIPMQ